MRHDKERIFIMSVRQCIVLPITQSWRGTWTVMSPT